MDPHNRLEAKRVSNNARDLIIAVLILLVSALLFMNYNNTQQASTAQGVSRNLYVLWVSRFDPTEPVGALQSYLQSFSINDLLQAEDALLGLANETAQGFGLYFPEASPRQMEIFLEASRQIGHGREGHVDKQTVQRIIRGLEHFDNAIHKDPMPTDAGGWPIIIDPAYIERVTQEALDILEEL